MEEHIVKILDIEPVTHDVRRFRVEKPSGYSFVPGQATEVSINKPDFRDERRPFTFTCLNSDPFLEFTIKIYPEHMGVTNELGKLKAGEEFIIHDVWGAIHYRGKGVFIAGGAGVTPFIAILRHLGTRNEIPGNMLIFANKTRKDIILENEFSKLLGKSFINILSQDNASQFYHGYINPAFLQSVISDFNQNFYVCGPPPMMDSVLKLLDELGVVKNSITIEL